MEKLPDQLAPLSDALAALRQEIAQLSARVAALEASAARPAQPPKSPATQAGAAPQPASKPTPELIAVITAVLAAHLGVRPHIRQIRLVSGAAWAQQGRVTIQASHVLAIQRD
jgi:methylmalonyl-CoA carboxyltransferase large subunit